MQTVDDAPVGLGGGLGRVLGLRGNFYSVSNNGRGSRAPDHALQWRCGPVTVDEPYQDSIWVSTAQRWSAVDP